MNVLTEDQIAKGTLKSRNKRREKVSDALVDLGKFLITGVAFAVVLKGDEVLAAGLSRVFVFCVGTILAGAILIWMGIRELRLLEDEA